MEEWHCVAHWTKIEDDEQVALPKGVRRVGVDEDLHEEAAGPLVVALVVVVPLEVEHKRAALRDAVAAVRARRAGESQSCM